MLKIETGMATASHNMQVALNQQTKQNISNEK